MNTIKTLLEMKYLTTDKHPELKEGIELHYEEYEHDSHWFTKTRLFSYRDNQKDFALEQSYIKELQEPEFTKQDMCDWGYWFVNNYGSDTSKTLNEFFKNWIKTKKQ